MAQSKTKFRAINDGIIVQRMECAEPHGRQIVMPENITPEPIVEGVIISVGGGLADREGKCEPLTVKLGDKVLFVHEYAQRREISKGIFSLRESDVMAVIVE